MILFLYYLVNMQHATHVLHASSSQAMVNFSGRWDGNGSLFMTMKYQCFLKPSYNNQR